MPTSFTINKIDYANTPGGPQTWTFKYKLFSDPDTAYVTISSSAAVAANGVLSVPLVVSGLTAGQLYYILAINNCNPGSQGFIQQVQL